MPTSAKGHKRDLTQTAANGREADIEANPFPAASERIPSYSKPFSLLIRIGKSSKSPCVKASSDERRRAPPVKTANFPAKFPVCREFSWRLVRSALLRQPRSPAFRLASQETREWAGNPGISRCRIRLWKPSPPMLRGKSPKVSGRTGQYSRFAETKGGDWCDHHCRPMNAVEYRQKGRGHELRTAAQCPEQIFVAAMFGSNDASIRQDNFSGKQIIDRGPGHRLDHLERDGGRDRRRRCVLERPRLRRMARARAEAAIDRRTARSSAAYRSAAIAICADCSFRLPGSCWSRSGQSVGTATGACSIAKAMAELPKA
jgi:hypothetical protein